MIVLKWRYASVRLGDTEAELAAPILGMRR